MYKLLIHFTKFAVIVLLIYIQPLYADTQWGEFNYSMEWCEQVVLNSSNNMLYLSCGIDNSIVEIDSDSMFTARSFQIETPYHMLLSNDRLYLYAVSISQWPVSYISRIRLSDGYIDNVSINGHTTSFTMNASGSMIWVSHFTYPAPDEYIGPGEEFAHNGSALITKLSTVSFSASQTTPAWVLPASIWYSDYSGDVFNTYEWVTPRNTGPANGAAIGVFDSDTLECVGQLPGGDTYGNSLGILMNLCNWTDDGRYAAVPNLFADMNKWALKIIDTTRSTSFKNFEADSTLVFFHPITGKLMGTEFLKKVPGTNIMWATSDDGNPSGDPNRARYVIKINTATQGYEVFEVPEATSTFGLFDVSSDGRILYLTQPKIGSVIKCAPGNHAPVCYFRPVTLPPYTGPSPVAVEFDASQTYDDDGDPLTFHWDFDGDLIFDEPVDDAYTGQPDNPTHEWTVDYDGPVVLKVTDDFQGECIFLIPIVVDVE